MTTGKKPEPLPDDPLDAIATLCGMAEDCLRFAREARRHADRALDEVKDAEEKAEALYNRIDAWFGGRRERGEPEPKVWTD